MIAGCQPPMATHTNLERRSTVFGRHWYDRALADGGSSAEPPSPRQVGSGLTFIAAPHLATAVAPASGVQEAAGIGVGRASQASLRRRVFDFDDET